MQKVHRFFPLDKVITSVISILFLVISCMTSFAQEDELPTETSFVGGLGTVTIDGAQWQRLSFRPDIPIGKFGIGLDIELFMDEEGNISKKGWDFSNKTASIETILRKIYYLRYGSPKENVYFRVGALDNVTLGYGHIMERYRNTLFYPGQKKVGLQFLLKDISSIRFGIEGMVNSFGDSQNSGAVIGTRLSAHPFAITQSSLLGRIEVGFTAVADINQYAGLRDRDDDGYPDAFDAFPEDKKKWIDTDDDGITDFYKTKSTTGTDSMIFVDLDADGDGKTDLWVPVHGWDDDGVNYDKLFNVRDNKDRVLVWGLDAGFPLIENPVKLDAYIQWGTLSTGNDDFEGGWGLTGPGLRLLAGNFHSRIEYRHINGRFLPQYFDMLYENDRALVVGDSVITKEVILADENLSGVYGHAGYRFFNLFELSSGYQYLKSDNGKNERFEANAKIHESILKYTKKITLLDAYYRKYNINRDLHSFFKSTSDTFYGYRIGVGISPGVSVIWDTRFIFTPKPGGGYERDKFINLETMMTFK